MKEHTLIQMKNTVTKLNQSLGLLYGEILRLQEQMAQIGAIQANMPCYEEAVKKFAEEIKENNEKAEAAQNASDKGRVDGIDEDANTTSEQKEVSQEEQAQEQGLDLDL